MAFSHPFIAFEELPQKNTFIDYPPQPMAHPPTPTSSAPAFLDRFKNLQLPESRPFQGIEVASHRTEISENFDSGSSTDCPSDGPAEEERATSPVSLYLDGLHLRKKDEDASIEIDSKKVPVKNTFIQFEVPSSPNGASEPPLSTAPGDFFKRLFHTREPESFVAVLPTPRLALDVPTLIGSAIDSAPVSGLEGTPRCGVDVQATGNGTQAHILGQCTPCSYFWYKKDGCRKGEACTFCHSCPKGEIKQRKKHRIQELRAAGVFSKEYTKMAVGESAHWVQVSL